jgi:hypothetical protein
MRKVLEFVGAVFVILSVGMPGVALCAFMFWVLMFVPQPWRAGLVFVAALASPFLMVVTVQWTFCQIERFLRWSKLV